jgi:hypothetical protein
MSVESDLRTARVTRVGFAGLLIFAGAIFIYTHGRADMPLADLAVCLVSIGLGIALLFNWWVARWLALGVCFLLIVAAIVMPVLVFLRQPPGASSGAVFSNAVFTVFMLAFGGIGYRCLGYFRSPRARREYSGDPDREQRLMNEGSSAVVLSAGAWFVFLLLAHVGGMSLPMWMITTRDVNADTPPPLAVGPSADQPPPSDVETPAPFIEIAGSPDIAPIGLCRAGDSWVGVTFENRGGSSARPADFTISYNNSIWNPGNRSSFVAQLPPPGGISSASLGSIGSLGGEEEMSNVIRLEFDPGNRIGESDERNNTPEYPISWDIFARLPECRSGQEVER